MIKFAGCNMQEITGLPKFNNYPPCEDNSSMEALKWKRNQLNQNSYLGTSPELEEESKQCPPRCRKLIYKVKEERKYKSTWDQAYVYLELDRNVLPYQRVEEQFAFTPDMLLSFIGGIIGIFLGFSTISLVDLVEFLYKKILQFI